MSDTEEHPLEGAMIHGEPDPAYNERPEQPVDREEGSFGRRAEKRIAKLLHRSKFAEDRLSATENENAALKRRLLDLERNSASAVATATTATVTEAEREMRQAKLDGDIDAELIAQSKLIDARTRLHDANQAKARAEAAVVEPSNVVQGPTPAMNEWLNENRDWFDTDPAMKSAAMSAHQDAVRKGIVPETPAYFALIDTKMRAAYPDYFDDAEEAREDDPEPQPERRPAARAPVAGAAPRRNAGPSGGRPQAGKMKATADEIEGAKIAGVPLPQYIAAKVARLARGN